MAVLDIAVAALAMVLVVSGVLKVRDPDATGPMLAAIGLPATPPVVYVVAAAEIVVGAAALVMGGRLATVALGLLYAAFAVVSLVLVRSGESVPCGCFGQRSTAMSPLHVAVDAAAAAVALAAAALGAPGLYAATGRAPAVVAVATVAAVLLAAAVVALLTGFGSRRRPVGGSAGPVPLALGSAPAVPGAAAELPAVSGSDLQGRPVRVTVAGSGRVTLLAFLTSGCTSCLRFWDAFGAPGGVALPGDGTELVIVTKGDDGENPARVRELAPAAHRVVRSTAAWADYGVTVGPSFVVVDGRSDRILGAGTATAWDDVAALVARAVAAGHPPDHRSPTPGVAE